MAYHPADCLSMEQIAPVFKADDQIVLMFHRGTCQIEFGCMRIPLGGRTVQRVAKVRHINILQHEHRIK
ncbi:hypothetical protein D3C87_1212880 [compost metagenome]